ncbi:hypothetical protein BYT27DRAFT_7253972 [Phlegmacium glaucopus]|nr:hypothetical protein BYT27DRAFT_7253972 [Phlegmacium glaucopus]
MPSPGIRSSTKVYPPSLGSPHKGKAKVEFNAHSDTKSQHEDEISDDWDENEMQLAMSKSHEINNKLPEGSSGNIVDDDDDPFIDVISKNVMPIPPSKPKKVYLEDFENFIVKALPEKDESFFLNVQDQCLRRQYKDLPCLR